MGSFVRFCWPYLLLFQFSLAWADGALLCRNLFEADLTQTTIYHEIKNVSDLAAILKCAAKSAACAEQSLSRVKGELPAHQAYQNILKYFDVKTLSSLQQGVKLKEIPSFDFIKQAAEQYQKNRDEIDFRQINTTKDFLDAGALLIGKRPRFRSYDVVMTDEVSKSDADLIKLDAQTYMQLKKNRLLVLYDQQAAVENEPVRTGISYSTLKTLKNIAKWQNSPFSVKLKEKLLGLSLTSRSSEQAKYNQTVYRESLRELVDVINQRGNQLRMLAPNSKIQKNEAFALYQIFMSIHPFTDGNGRIGRLLYEYLTWKKSGDVAVLQLPIFDFDLLSQQTSETDLAVGSILYEWVSRAKSDQEFLDKANQALQALRILYSNSLIINPDAGASQ